MAISRLSTSGISNFKRYNDVQAGSSSTNNYFVTGGGSYSADGITWSACSGAFSTGAMYYNPVERKFIQWYESGNNVYFSNSTDGINFKYNGMLTDGTFSAVSPMKFTPDGKEYFGALRGQVIFDNRWAYRHLTLDATNGARQFKVNYDGALTWAVATTAGFNTAQGQYKVMASPSGTDFPEYVAAVPYGDAWSTYTPPDASTRSCDDLIEFNGLWLYANSAGIYSTANIATSTPTWTSRSTAGGRYFVKLSPTEIWAFASGASTSIWRSTNGTTWTAITMPASKSWVGIASANGMWVAAASDGTVATSTSGNSATFTARTTTASACQLYGITYGG